ncbi:hypothetical protein KKG45_12755 [bacterium]|nr:hypothetical protein [bacterium]MBU1074109.1 hypothetical protein [bacterium]MBU1676027.1 hypothetical protein [bacterium]
MDGSSASSHRGFLDGFRVVCYVCALYFLAMGLALVLFPAFIARIAGPQDPVILGMLRGAGGSIVPYSLLYVFVARSPLTRRWAAAVIAAANILAIALDMLSVYLGEYRLGYAMLDVPVEAASLLMMLLLSVKCVDRSQPVVDGPE